MSDVQKLNYNETTYCDSFNSTVNCSVPMPEALKETSVNPNLLTPWKEERQNLLDSYLIRLNLKSKVSKSLMESNALQGVQQLSGLSKKQPLTEEQKKATQDKYNEKSKERLARMYEKGLAIAIQREIEEGRKFRSQRTIKFNIHYGTYVRNIYS